MIVVFLTPLRIEEIDDDNWRLIAPFRASLDVHAPIEVPEGFSTDFASVPRIPIIFEKFGNRAHKPAVLHDYLYSLGGTLLEKEFADNVLRYACVADGMNVLDALQIYLAVKNFGGPHWKFTQSLDTIRQVP